MLHWICFYFKRYNYSNFHNIKQTYTWFDKKSNGDSYEHSIIILLTIYLNNIYSNIIINNEGNIKNVVCWQAVIHRLLVCIIWICFWFGKIQICVSQISPHKPNLRDFLKDFTCWIRRLAELEADVGERNLLLTKEK